MMTISVLKERKVNEKRVIITPREVEGIVALGHSVLVENNCGIECLFSNGDYEKAGAKIVNQYDAWTLSDLILKFKSPLQDEYKFFSQKTTLAALFHAEGDYNLLKAMTNAKLTAYSFEYFETSDGFFPLAYPGGEIAGKSAVLYAAYFLQNHLGGKGKMLCDITGVSRPKIGIIGYGSVGCAAINLAISLGCDVIVFGTKIEKLRKLQICYGNAIKIYKSSKENFELILPTLDVLIGAILISTYDTEPLIENRIIKKMAPGSLVIDVTCGYGDGYLPFIKETTTLDNPVKTIDGINCIKIDNLPSAYHLTSTNAYSKNLYPYLLRLIESLDKNEVDPVCENGCIIKQGIIVHKEIKKHWNYYEKN